MRQAPCREGLRQQTPVAVKNSWAVRQNKRNSSAWLNPQASDGSCASRVSKDERDGLISSLTAFVAHTADGCPHNFFASYAFISFERIDNSVNITTGFYFEMVSWESTGIAT